MTERVLVTGGAGYIGIAALRGAGGSGAPRARAGLVAARTGRRWPTGSSAPASRSCVGDIRDGDIRRGALEGADAVVHLAAIVGDPACALTLSVANEVNVAGSAGLVAGRDGAGVKRFVFASTCSNYGRMADPTRPGHGGGRARPGLALCRAEGRRSSSAARAHVHGALRPTCLRFATVYGVAPRMRFDLTVNEFTRDLWADRDLEVFGEQFWRPYIHVADAGRGVRIGARRAAREGRRRRGLQRRSLRRELPQARPRGGDPATGHRPAASVSCAATRIRVTTRSASRRSVTRLGFETPMTVPDGIAEVIAALGAGDLPEPFDRRYRNIP